MYKTFSHCLFYLLALFHTYVRYPTRIESCRIDREIAASAGVAPKRPGARLCQSVSDPMSAQSRTRTNFTQSFRVERVPLQNGHIMASKTTVDALNAGVGQLDISGRRSPAYMMDGNDVIFMPKVSTCKPIELRSVFI